MNNSVELTKEPKENAQKKFTIDVVYNGITKPLEVEPEQAVTGVLQRAIALFGVTQAPHLLSLFRLDGSQVPETGSVQQAGIKPGEVLLLRPNAVKGGALQVAPGLLAATFDIFQACGQRECECAVFWTGSAEGDVVDGLEHPTHMRSPYGYEVDTVWLTQFWKRLAGAKRSIKVQVHTHPGEAFHSATDDAWPIIAQEGFLSIVIPDFATGPPTLDHAWVGRLKVSGDWEQLRSAEKMLVFNDCA